MKSMRKMLWLSLFLLMTITGFSMSKISASASSTVRVTYNNKIYTYTKKKTYVKVNNKVVSIKTKPVFYNGAYMGPASKILKSSGLGVTYKSSSDHKTLTLTYKGRTLKLTSGSKKAYLNGKQTKLLKAPMYVTYTDTGKSGWVVPLWGVCDRLKIKYSIGSDGVIRITGTSTSTSSTTTTTVSNASTSGKVVLVLDAGHGGTDSGAVNSKRGLKEKNMTLAIVRAAKKYFDKDSRFKVYYTRTSDTYPSLNARCVLANKVNADAFICVHINDSTNTKATGTETLYNKSRNKATKKGNITSYQLAKALQQYTLNTTGFVNRGLVNRPGLRVLRKTNMPACLIEYGFISNNSQAITMNANLKRYGKGLYQGIVSFMRTKGRIK